MKSLLIEDDVPPDPYRNWRENKIKADKQTINMLYFVYAGLVGNCIIPNEYKRFPEPLT